MSTTDLDLPDETVRRMVAFGGAIRHTETSPDGTETEFYTLSPEFEEFLGEWIDRRLPMARMEAHFRMEGNADVEDD